MIAGRSAGTSLREVWLASLRPGPASASLDRWRYATVSIELPLEARADLQLGADR